MSLAEKLKSLGVKTGTADLRPPAKGAGNDIASVLAGSVVNTALGDAFIYEERFAGDYSHGLAPIRLSVPLSIISAWAAEPRFSTLDLSSFIFLDTETSGLAGGTGTYAFLVGAARFIGGELVLKQFFMRDPAE